MHFQADGKCATPKRGPYIKCVLRLNVAPTLSVCYALM